MSSTTLLSTSASSTSANSVKEMKQELNNIISSIKVIDNKIKQLEDKCKYDDIETERQLKEMMAERDQIYRYKNIKTREEYDTELKMVENARTVANQSLMDMVLAKEEDRILEEAAKLEEELIESMKDDLLERERQFQTDFKANMTKLLEQEEKEQAQRLETVLQFHKTELSILKEMV